MSDPNILNIPAYQRKRSIAAQARKTNLVNKSPDKPRKVTRKRLDPIDPITEMAIHHDFMAQEPEQSSFKKSTKFKEMKTCGSCEGYYDKIDVAILSLTSPLRIGDIILIEKNDGLFQQEIKSMQIDRKEVKIAKTGSEIGLKTSIPPKIGGTIYKVL